MKARFIRTAMFCCGIALITTQFSCKKNELEPSVKGVPVLQIEGDYMGSHFQWIIGNTSIAGVASSEIVVDSDSISLRHFIFESRDSLNINRNIITFDFTSYNDLLVDNNANQDSTFLPGTKAFSTSFNNPISSPQLNTVAINLSMDNNNPLTSRTLSPNPGSFKIDSTKVIIWKDNKPYKMVYASFNCRMVDSQNPQDTLITRIFSNGKAVLAFPRK